MTSPMSAAAALRARTSARHDAVDSAFGAFRLDRADSYRDFLLAHARALPAAEAVLLATSDLPGWRPRTPLLAQDVAEAGGTMPAPIPFVAPTAAFAWGVLYVVEGSRLGGAMLARQVAPGYPRRYLDAAFAPGEWRALRDALNAEGARGGDGWLQQAIEGAEACFALYACAAGAAA